MDPFSMTVAIVLIVAGAKVLSARYRHRDEAGGKSLQPSPDADRMRDELRSLKERVAVLERIATDANTRSALLDDEIERLRDRP